MSTEFPSFTKLPSELRREIWALSFLPRPFHELIDKYFVGFRGEALKESLEEGFRQSKASIATSQVCRESRTEFLRHLDRSFPNFLSAPNYDVDTLANGAQWRVGGGLYSATGPCAWVSAIYRHRLGDVVVRMSGSRDVFYLHCLNYWDVELMRRHTSTL